MFVPPTRPCGTFQIIGLQLHVKLPRPSWTFKILGMTLHVRTTNALSWNLKHYRYAAPCTTTTPDSDFENTRYTAPCTYHCHARLGHSKINEIPRNVLLTRPSRSLKIIDMPLHVAPTRLCTTMKIIVLQLHVPLPRHSGT